MQSTVYILKVQLDNFWHLYIPVKPLPQIKILMNIFITLKSVLILLWIPRDSLGKPKRFFGSSAGKRICLQCRRPWFDSWVGKIHWRRDRLPTSVFCPGEFHGLCSPWGRKESDIPEWLSFSINLFKQWLLLASMVPELVKLGAIWKVHSQALPQSYWIQNSESGLCCQF